MKKITGERALFTVLVLTLLVGTLMPGSVKSDIEVRLSSAVPWSALAHFTLFGAIAALPVYGPGLGGTGRALLLAVALAASTELLQSWVPGRHPLMRDALIDLSGALAGLALRSLWLLQARQPQGV